MVGDGGFLLTIRYSMLNALVAALPRWEICGLDRYPVSPRPRNNNAVHIMLASSWAAFLVLTVSRPSISTIMRKSDTILCQSRLGQSNPQSFHLRQAYGGQAEQRPCVDCMSPTESLSIRLGPGRVTPLP